MFAKISIVGASLTLGCVCILFAAQEDLRKAPGDNRVAVVAEEPPEPPWPRVAGFTGLVELSSHERNSWTLRIDQMSDVIDFQGVIVKGRLPDGEALAGDVTLLLDNRTLYVWLDTDQKEYHQAELLLSEDAAKAVEQYLNDARVDTAIGGVAGGSGCPNPMCSPGCCCSTSQGTCVICCNEGETPSCRCAVLNCSCGPAK